MRELIIDSFAGGGGASTGIEMALGRSPDIAINHDAIAMAMHRMNHPATMHIPHDVWKVDPAEVCRGRPVGLLWASPDCKHFSKAKGGKPFEKSIRDLAWVIVKWAKQVAPRVIMMENVEEFKTWGPLGPDNRPCKLRRGEEFERFVGELKKLGYAVEWRELRACDYGAPTIRKRLFLIARRDGAPIVWPKPTHGDPKSEAVKSGALEPWRTAAEIIDWSLPCHSIFLTKEEAKVLGIKRPLAPATMARIAKGVKRYVLEAKEPFIVNLTHQGGDRNEAVTEPFTTLTGAHRGERAVAVPTLADGPQFHCDAYDNDFDDPHCTGIGMLAPAECPICGEEDHISDRHSNQRIAAHIRAAAEAKGFSGTACGPFVAGVGGRMGQSAPRDVQDPAQTMTAKADSVVVAPSIVRTDMTSGYKRNGVMNPAELLNLKGSDRRGSAPDAPGPTQTADGKHIAATSAFLQKYYGADQDPQLEEPLHTATTKDRFGVVTVEIRGVLYAIADIGMRMLTPRELFRAQGFPDSYIIDQGKHVAIIRKGDDADIEQKIIRISKTEQVSKCGNSVCPQMSCALVGANFEPQDVEDLPEYAREAAE